MSKNWTPTKANAFYGASARLTAKCSVITQDRFQVDLSGYSEEAIVIFKSIPSRQYGKFGNHTVNFWMLIICFRSQN